MAITLFKADEGTCAKYDVMRLSALRSAMKFSPCMICAGARGLHSESWINGVQNTSALSPCTAHISVRASSEC